MEDHGGQVTLDDRPDGPGTVAALLLPIGPGAGADMADAAAAAGLKSSGIHHGA
jgi:hypothetical protein